MLGRDYSREVDEVLKSQLAGRQGLEPRYADPESAVLPLDDLPMVLNASITRAFAVPESLGNVKNAMPKSAFSYFLLGRINRCRGVPGLV